MRAAPGAADVRGTQFPNGAQNPTKNNGSDT